VQQVPGTLSAGVKRPESGATHSPHLVRNLIFRSVHPSIHQFPWRVLRAQNSNVVIIIIITVNIIIDNNNNNIIITIMLLLLLP